MLKTVLNRYQNLNLLTRFIVNILILSAIWFVFYNFFRYSSFINIIYENVVNSLTQSLLWFSKILLSAFGYDTTIHGKVIRIVGTGGVLLDRGCLGRNLIGLFVGFILAYPGKAKHKLWSIPLGIIIINLLNILRIAGLTFIVLRYPEYVDINHHVIFKYTVYFFIFLMWYFWIKYFSASSKNNKITKKNT